MEKKGQKGSIRSILFSYSMDARSELLSTYSAVLFVGIIVGVVCFAIWGKRAEIEAFEKLWAGTRAWSTHKNGGEYIRFFIRWFFHYETPVLLILLSSITLGSPLMCGAICLWRGILTGWSCAMLAGGSFSVFFVAYVAVSVAISFLYVMFSCKSVWFFRRLVAHIRVAKPDFWKNNALPLAISFVLISAALLLALGGCGIAAQVIYHRLG